MVAKIENPKINDRRRISRRVFHISFKRRRTKGRPKSNHVQNDINDNPIFNRTRGVKRSRDGSVPAAAPTAHFQPGGHLVTGAGWSGASSMPSTDSRAELIESAGANIAPANH